MSYLRELAEWDGKHVPMDPGPTWYFMQAEGRIKGHHWHCRGRDGTYELHISEAPDALCWDDWLEPRFEQDAESGLNDLEEFKGFVRRGLGLWLDQRLVDHWLSGWPRGADDEVHHLCRHCWFETRAQPGRIPTGESHATGCPKAPKSEVDR